MWWIWRSASLSAVPSGKIVTSFVNDVLMPPLGGCSSGILTSAELKLTLKEAGADGKPVTLNYGSFINAVIDFAIVAFCVFLVVKAAERAKTARTPADPTEKPCPECGMLIPIKAKRCGHCTSVLA